MKRSDDITDFHPDLTRLEEDLHSKGFRAICGVDEAGRGPLAGPVVAAAVIMPPGIEVEGLDDSKRLTETKREAVFDRIASLGLICAVGIIDHTVIDSINIHKASLKAMCRAVMELTQSPDFILVDGRHCIPNLSQPQLAIVSGDHLCKAISAASIIAKVTRDRIMDRYEALYPSFSFSTHKGYPTPAHLEELQMYGPCDIHRRSFRPVSELVHEPSLFS